MKKTITAIGVAAAVLLLILFLPIPKAAYDDGGTREYIALTYKIVDWNRITDFGTGPFLYEKTRIYGFADRGTSIDDLWERESARFGKRGQRYTEEWLDKNTAERYDTNIFRDIVIAEIYENCFFARTVIPMPYEIKLNGTLSEEWCVGDQVICTYENVYYDPDSNRVEVDFRTVEASDWEPDPFVAYKPVIYLYPKKQTEVSVKLTLNGALTCTYPLYKNGWQITAAPDGTLTDENGQTYNYLYWEGDLCTEYDLTEGFCIKGEDTAAFLEDALSKLGLTRREANEFIVFWLPLMEQNAYNVISFQPNKYTEAAELEISPTPDTLIRVFMVWQASDTCKQIKEQNLTAPSRTGFTVVEWGGTEIPKGLR